jgi:hypothetical protein
MTRFHTLLTAAAFALTGTSVLAQSPQALCVAAPAQIAQAAAAKAGTPEARKALYNSSTAVKLCEAGAAKEAQKKFKIAYKALNLDYAAALAQAGAQAN